AATPPPAPPAADKGKPRDDKGGKRGKGGKDTPAAAPVRTAAAVPPPEPQVGRETSTPAPQLAQAAPAPKPTPRPTPPPPPPPPTPAPAPLLPSPTPPAPTPGFTTVAQGPGFDLAKAPAATPVRSDPPKPAPAPKPAPSPSIDEAFADLAPPSREVEPQAGAVDIRRVRPAAPPAQATTKGKDPAKDGKPAAPSHPSRIWVQLATGRDKSALGFDWRKMAKDNPALFKGLRPFVTAWGQSNRLLAGPFDTAKEANAFLAAAKKAGISGGFVWTSPAGQIVDALGGGK
ncbi:MAG TPA: SPOR domain-containing protein, partial [Novosphingobium sp.]|nr:SPOR domain-containing protein [Novosphingobium sp.]